ncbi:hypothetical protein [Ruminococcus callidus]|uniref:hypothetical protein n=1 Tax=Ruminococcus callidus TaxID=40519 RepID=UPI0035218750
MACKVARRSLCGVASSSLVTLKYNKAALRAMHLPYSTGGMRILFFFRGESARRPAEMATADLLKDSKPPLTLRPNFNREKGSVTAAAAACLPRRGIFATCNLRVIFDLVAQVKCELFSFFASFFLFSKEKKKRNSL